MKQTKTFCNKCGKEFDIWDGQEGYKIYCTAGYGTKYDGMKIELDLCCGCMEELLDGCVLPAHSEIEKPPEIVYAYELKTSASDYFADDGGDDRK